MLIILYMTMTAGSRQDQQLVGNLLERAGQEYDVNNWQVLGVRDGLVEAIIPLADVFLEEDPVMESKVAEYADDMRVNGQLESVLTGLVIDVPDNPHRIANGLHRQRGLQLIGAETIATSIMPEIDIDALQARKIRATKGIHDESEILRVARWSEDVWSRTDWANDFGVERAFEFTAYVSMRRESVIPDSEREAVENFVRERAKEWNMSPRLVVKYLRIRDGFDDEVLSRVTTKSAGFTKKAAEMTVNAFSDVVDLETGETDYDLPYVLLVAETANRLNLTTAQVKELNSAILFDTTTIEEAEALAANYTPKPKPGSGGGPRGGNGNGPSSNVVIDASTAGPSELTDALHNCMGSMINEHESGTLRLTGAQRRRMAQVGKGLLEISGDNSMFVVDLNPPTTNGHKPPEIQFPKTIDAVERGRLRALHESVSGYITGGIEDLPTLPLKLTDTIKDVLAGAIRAGFRSQDDDALDRIKSLQTAITAKYAK